jgi:N6-L-threonylcarbamoyladenine synthase
MLKIQADPNKGYGAALESFCLGQPLGTSEFSVDKGYPFPPLKYSLPNPWQKDIFSFTGLTAAVQRVVESRELNPHERWSTAVAFQEAVISQLELKLKGAIRWCQKNDVDVSSLVVSGGVASNTFLRKR